MTTEQQKTAEPCGEIIPHIDRLISYYRDEFDNLPDTHIIDSHAPGLTIGHLKTIRAHLSKLSGGAAPQSDMVAVPRTILEVLHQSSKLALGNYDYQCGYLDAVKEAKSLLQPYTKGRGG